MKSSRRASRSGNALPSSVAGAWNLGDVRSTGVGTAGGLLAQSEASVRVSRSQNVQVGVEGKQQRQQQWTSGAGEPVTVVSATVGVGSCSDVVVSSELIKSVVVSVCDCGEVLNSAVVVADSVVVAV